MLPIELIRMIVMNVDDVMDFRNLLLSNKIFRKSVSLEDLLDKRISFRKLIINENPRTEYYIIPLKYNRFMNIVHGDYRLDGKYESWYNNGNKKLECEYDNNKLHNGYKYYRREGDIRYIFNYKNGVKHGLCTTLYSTGIICIMAEYSNGKCINVLERNSVLNR